VCGDIQRAFEAGPGPEEVAVMIGLFRTESRADVLAGRAALVPEDVRVGLRVMNLAGADGVRDFEQGEVVEVETDDAGVRTMVVQWDSAGRQLPIDVATVNQRFTAQHMMDKLLAALQAAKDAPERTKIEAFRIALSEGDHDAAAGGGGGGGGGHAAAAPTAAEVQIVLTQQQVASALIPAVQQEWASLFRTVRWRTIKTGGLTRQFGFLKTKERRAAEATLLLATGAGNIVTAGGGDSVADECPICLDPLTPETSATLAGENGVAVCTHIFHTQCSEQLPLIDPVLGDDGAVVTPGHKECPICRVKFAGTTRMPTDPQVLVSIEDFVLSMRLRKWIPDILHVRTSMNRLCELQEDDDAWMTQLGIFHLDLERDWDQQTLGSISGLVAPVRTVFESFHPGHLDFFARLAQDDGLVEWLLEHNDTSAFNRLLQVCRPRTDDPRLLKAIASLVEVRTLMIDMMYVEGAAPGIPPYRSLSELLESVKRVDMSRGKTIGHLENVQSSFDGLRDLFEKETRSPGIKACYDLDEIRRLGEFVLIACADRDAVMRLQLPKTTGSDSMADATDADASASGGAAAAAVKSKTGSSASPSTASDADLRHEPLEYCLDLRSKLIMVEIPVELEEEIPDLRRVIEHFSEQLQLMEEIRDALHTLYTGGHFGFQGGYSERYTFVSGDMTPLRMSLASLKTQIADFHATQHQARNDHYFLNYFTMREILRMTVLLDSAAAANVHLFGTAEAFHAALEQSLGGNVNAAKSSVVSAAGAPATSAAVGSDVNADALASVDAEELTGFCGVCGADKATGRAFLARFKTPAAAMSAYFDNDGVLPPDDTSACPDSPKSLDGGDVYIDEDHIAIVQAMCNTDPDTARAFLARFGDPASAEAAFNQHGGMLPDDTPSGGSASEAGKGGEQLRAKAAARSYVMSKRFQVALEFNSMLHLVSSFIRLETAIAGMMRWSALRAKNSPDAETDGTSADAAPETIDMDLVLRQIAAADSKETLDGLGSLLTSMFADEKELLRAPTALAAFVDSARSDQAVMKAATREVPKPGEGARNRHDLVGVVTRSEKDERSVPIWVTCAESTSGVIDVVLSVYLRRGRLPEPGEILFCTTDTSLEDIEILLRRWMMGRQHGRKDLVFCLADIHALVYTKQCAVVDMLQELLAEHGHKEAANLLIVSGKERQVVLNSLSQYALECPPLDAAALQKACTEAFEAHCGETAAVVATINGAGKTRSIMKLAAQKQAATAAGEKMLLYRRLPIREASTASSVLAVLSRLPELDDHLIHVDVGHIIPGCANTLLFELLIVGTIRDTVNCKVYHRRRGDVFMLEVPNSIDDKTAVALRISALLPIRPVIVAPEELSFDHPVLCNKEGTLIEMVEDKTVKFVCKFLRALHNRVFDTGSEIYNLMYQPSATVEQQQYIDQLQSVLGTMGMELTQQQAQAWLARCDWEFEVTLNNIFDGQEAPRPSAVDTDITTEECFNVLVQFGTIAEGDLPNFGTLMSFVKFMFPQLRAVTEWPMINSPALGEGFIRNNFKQSFIRMLLATARDFTGRSVPQGNQVRLEADGNAFVVGGRYRPARQGSDGGRIARALSASASAEDETDDALHIRRQGSLDGGPPPAVPLTAADAADVAARFQSMISWENSEHPVAVWKIPHHGRGVDGIDILTLNSGFADDFLSQDLRANLRECGFDFNRDWSKLTNDEAVNFLRHSVGVMTDQPTSLQHGYVLTIDNLLKMLSVAFRLKFGLPAVVMGETGCGKSSLMRSMCSILTWRLYTLNIHGGMTDKAIIEWMQGVLTTIEGSPDKNMFGQEVTHVIFLDEVNTCNCMALFNEIICDRTMDGVPIPEHVRIVAACNPYRLRITKATAGTETGLVFDLHDENADDAENVGTGIKDPLSDLVYRVHPLPESMTDNVFDFGALSDKTEKLYILAMVRSMLKLYLTEEATVEELSTDDQIDERARRLGIDVVEGMTQEDKVQAIRLRMREVVMEEARRRAGAGVGAGAPGAAPAAAPAAPVPVHRVDGDYDEDEGTSDDDEDDEDRHDPQEHYFGPGEGGFGAAPAAAGLFGAAPAAAGLFGAPGAGAGGFGGGAGLFGMPPGMGAAAEDADPEMNERIANASREVMMEMQESDPFGDASFGGRRRGGGGGGYDYQKFQAKSRFGEFVDTFTDLICTAQEFVREFHGGERSSASLRDVARCIKVYRWFGEHITAVEEAKGAAKAFSRIDFFAVKPAARRAIRDAVVMSIAYCYHSRLPREARTLLRMELADAWSDLQTPPKYTTYGWYTPGKECCAWLDLSNRKIMETIEGVQKAFVQQMKFPEGIALNEALCENVFMMLVSVLNQIPIFVIGKPGTSKSLAMELVQTNLQGVASSNDFLKSLPAVQIFSYQCSPLSTSGGIEAAFESARRYKMEAPNTIVVVLLDEVGLAEQSPHLPLKVLHKTLDEAKENESVVGISNWSLDPAKMNRAVHLYRPAPTVEDLALTAEGMVRSATLKGYLQAIAQSFSGVYFNQELADFWGMREFYSTVRSVNKCITSDGLSPTMIMNAILRNYGGRPNEMEGIIARFFECLTMNPEGVPRASVVDLVKQNIVEPEARHLMLLTKNNVALSMLFDYQILTHSESTVIFGSDFPLDKTDLQIVLMLQRVKHCMANGVTLVLVHCEALYESMYDLLNQHYTEVGGQLWVRLAFGTHSRLCPIDPAFRVIVVVETTDAYTRLAPPLLNRFEKQVLERSDMVSAVEQQFIDRIQLFARVFAARGASDAIIRPGTTTARDLKVAFSGFHPDMICSLCMSLVHEAEQTKEAIDWNSLYQDGIRRLLWTATPEAACRILQNDMQRRLLNNEHQVDVAEVYFSQQNHSNVMQFAADMDVLRRKGRPQLSMLMTHAPLFLGAAQQIEKQGSWTQVLLVVLHDLSSERDLQAAVDAFFENAEPGALLLVQCDPRAASLRRVSHAQYICEKAAEDFRLNHAEFFAEQDSVVAAPEEAGSVGGGAAAGGAGAAHAPTDNMTGGLPADADEGMVDKRSPEERERDEKDRMMKEKDGSRAETEPEAVAPRAKTVDVIFLVHLQRSDGTTFNVDFDERWFYAFIDSITPASNHGLLDVEDMMGVTLSQMLESTSIDLAKILASNFRFAMARLVYLYERTNEDVRGQISLVLNYLHEHSFIDTVQQHMLVMVEEYDLALDLSRITDSDAGVSLVGTFQQALHQQFTDALSALFSVILSHMDRNGALALFGNTTLRSLWLYLFRKSFEDMNIVNRRRFTMKTMGFTLEVKADGTDKKPFDSQFPFSFFISDALESMREAAETIGAKGDVVDGASVALQRQFDMLSFEHGLAGVLSADLLDRYAFDFAAMHMPNSAVFAKPDQTKLLWAVLSLFVSEVPISMLGQIHGRFWGCKSRLKLYCDMLDAVPTAIGGTIASLSTTPAEELRTQFELPDGASTSVAVDMSVLNQVFEHLVSSSQELNSHEDYGRWCTQLDSVNAAVVSLLAKLTQAVGTKHSAFKTVQLQWEKLCVVNQFVRDIAVPMNVDPTITVLFAHGLYSSDLRTQPAFRILVKYLCSELTVSDAKFARGDVSSTKGNASPDGSGVGGLAAADADLASAAERAQTLLRGANGLMEVYLDLCFGEQTIVTDSMLLEDLVRVLASKDLDGMPGVSAFYQNLVSSEAGRVALLSSIVSVNPEELRIAVKDYLHAELWSGASASGVVDSPLAVTYLTVLERSVAAPDIVAAKTLGASLELDKLGDAEVPVQERLQIVAIIRRLVLLYADLVCKCIEPMDGETIIPDDIAQLKQLAEVVDPLLLFSKAYDHSLTRSMRMFLLKAVERHRGVAYVRSVMQQAPVHGSGWMVEWIAENEVGLVRFMGANKLPQHNPFSEEELYPEAVRAVAEYLANGDLITTIEAFVVAHASDSAVKSALALGLFHEVGLLPVLPDSTSGVIGPRVDAIKLWLKQSPVLDFFEHNERGILLFCAGAPPLGFAVRATKAGVPGWTPAGEDAPADIGLPDSASDSDEETAQFRNTITFKSRSGSGSSTGGDDASGGGGGGGAAVPTPALAPTPAPDASSVPPPSAHGYEEAAKFLTLDSTSSPEKILAVRLFAHLAARAMAAQPGSQLYFYRLALLGMPELAGTKFPTMPDDAMYMVQRALMEAGADRGAQRWFTCPNGHPFAIGNCGGATQESRCPECNEPIGGTGHTLLASNKALGGTSGEGADNVNALFQRSLLVDNSEPNYCIGTIAEENKFFTSRSLNPQALRVIRSLMHTCFTVGFYVGGDDWVAKFEGIVNANNVGTIKAGGPGSMVLGHLRNDLSLLKGLAGINDEQVTLLLHEVILCADRVDEVTAASVGGASAGAGAGAGAGTDTEELRQLNAELDEMLGELEELREQGGGRGSDDDGEGDEYEAEIEELEEAIAAIREHIAGVVARGGGGGGRGGGGGARLPGQTFQVGDLVTVGSEYEGFADASSGPVKPGEFGKVIEVGGGRQPIKVEANGRGWWYMTEALQMSVGGAIHPSVVGQRVLLAPDFSTFPNAVVAGRGLNGGEIGIVSECQTMRSKPWCQVTVGNGSAADGGSCWYEARALLVAGSGKKKLLLPEKLEDGKLREQWEKVFQKSVLDNLLKGDGIADRLQAIEARFTDEDSEGIVFKEELLERKARVKASRAPVATSGSSGGGAASAAALAAIVDNASSGGVWKVEIEGGQAEYDATQTALLESAWERAVVGVQPKGRPAASPADIVIFEMSIQGRPYTFHMNKSTGEHWQENQQFHTRRRVTRTALPPPLAPAATTASPGVVVRTPVPPTVVPAATAAPRAAMPALWMYTRPFSFEHFEAAFANTQENAELFPVLSAFLEKRSVMTSLQHLPAFFRYIDLVMERFDKSIDHAGSRSMTVEDAMVKLTPQQRRIWDHAYESFETVWNLSWKHVERFGCQEVPDLYKGQVMSPSTPIAFSLPGESDEAMCPFYLSQYLIEQHNDFVQRVDQALLMRRQDLQRHSTRVNEISSGFMTEAHVLHVNTETEFAPYVLKQCVRYDAASAEAICDFGSAEKFLLDRYFRNKPLINLRLRGFKYADDRSSGRNLSAKIAQETLQYDVARRIKEELQPWPANAIRALEILETCINFLTSASFALSDTVGERRLDSYLKDDLLMVETELEPLGVVIRQQVKLAHLDSLVELLQALTDQDPLEKVAVVYRADLPAEAATALETVAEFLELEVLLPVFKMFLLTTCVAEQIAPDSELKGSLDWCTVAEGAVHANDFMNEFDWFNAHFPESIELKHAVAAYKFLLALPA
jgi:hypothetical protein